MLEPVKERIILAIVEALKMISSKGGYSYDYTVERRKRGEGNRPEPNKVVVFQGKPQPDTETTGGEGEGAASGVEGGIRYWRLPMVLVVSIMHSDASSDSIDTICNRVEADLEKALMQDPQFGGLAQDTIIEGAEQLEDEESGVTGLIFPFDVKYDTLLADPYSRGVGSD